MSSNQLGAAIVDLSDGPVCGAGLRRLSLQGELREVSFVFSICQLPD